MLILTAHGTRSAAGAATIHTLRSAVARRIGPVVTSFVDVLGPNPAEVLAVARGPAVVVPAFLASGYHVRTDLPAAVASSGCGDVLVTPALGPDRVLATVMRDRLYEVGWRRGDAVVMAAAGSSDRCAQRELRRAAALLAGEVGSFVPVGFVATGTPRVADVVGRLRADGRRRVFVASYLLAPGLFHSRLASCGADGVAAPLGTHP
ncbi:MAG: sirohydrochlorin chelatase, partial [Mycobacteriaceae bacterium]|nr:sirohydrochlorin chelatase [Mycobacteriaceae bacterium]